MNILNVPTASITELKNSPKSIFNKAKEKDNGVYIFNRNNVEGVVLSQEQFETLNETIEKYETEIEELKILTRINDNTERLSDEEVRGKSIVNTSLNSFNEWD
ncbi:type II toxin-antitoxin system Phd/YefM family antitoxin [Staphylococcus croceilyticus]|uniref:Type II toxin-antitoxin system Phd/YefM family antitoxin n=1 Tax=Staphylococcus croceilyticus TaxID=319942 RepID=A0ABY2KHH2_9STAP|nr:type II toxin-antitoxin system Phd/YefM family antitoxin [Staphylococcus croceilyticus]PNZ70647.1 hypothetical protein CD128_01800 [Staphylococcus croceilyticus]TGA80944.1 type II toxin-antitoxin system Phd/YefM family antitoxin [Staphylococcus croceilyticus]